MDPGGVTYTFNRNDINFWKGYNRSTVDGYFTLYYTKTIDTPTTISMIPAIVQETGDSMIQTMSQKAITDAINIFTEGEMAQQKAMLQAFQDKVDSLEQTVQDLKAIIEG